MELMEADDRRIATGFRLQRIAVLMTVGLTVVWYGVQAFFGGLASVQLRGKGRELTSQK